METLKYKVGDKVRLTFPLSPMQVGDIGVVAAKYAPVGYNYIVDFPAFTGALVFEREVEAAKNPSNTLTTISRLIRRATRSGRRTGEALRSWLQKETGKTSLNGWFLWHSYLRKYTQEVFTKGGYSGMPWPTTVSFLWGEPAPEQRPFKVGDRVKVVAKDSWHNNSPDMDSRIGTIGTVVSLDREYGGIAAVSVRFADAVRWEYQSQSLVLV
jgi:hypothetical protein